MNHVVYAVDMSRKAHVWGLTLLLDRKALGMVPGLGMVTPGSLVEPDRIAATLFTDVHVSIVVQQSNAEDISTAAALVSNIFCTIPTASRRENVDFYTHLEPRPPMAKLCRPPLKGPEAEIAHAVAFKKYQDIPHYPNAFFLANNAISLIQPADFVVLNLDCPAMGRVKANVAMLAYCSGDAKKILSDGVCDGDMDIGSDGELNAVIIFYESVLAGSAEILKKMVMIMDESDGTGIEYESLCSFGSEGDAFFELVAHGREQERKAREDYYQRALEAWFGVKKVQPGLVTPKKRCKTAPRTCPGAPDRSAIASLRQPKLVSEQFGVFNDEAMRD